MRSTKQMAKLALALLAASSAADAWGGARGDPFFYRGAMPSEPRWPHHGFRQPVHQRPQFQPQQHPQHHQRRQQPAHQHQPQPQPEFTQPARHQHQPQHHQQQYQHHHQPPPPAAHQRQAQRTPTEELTDAFLRRAGDDVVLSSVELAELLGVAEGRPRGDTPRRPAVLQLLQQWDVNRDGGLNLNEFIGLYAELQRQLPQLFQQHLANLRAANESARQHDALPPQQHQQPSVPPTGQQPHQQQQHQPTWQQQPPTQRQPSRPTASTSQQHQPAARDPEDSPQGRRGKLTYVDIERNERFYSMVFDDPEEGEEPLVVSTVWSTREVGQTDTWQESEVW